MNTLMHIRLNTREGAVLRTLGLIERRGFRLLDMNLQELAGERRLSLGVDGGERNAEVLRRQLLRLEDVYAVMLQEACAPQPIEGEDSPHKCVRALGEFGVRHRVDGVFNERPAIREHRHVG